MATVTFRDAMCVYPNAERPAVDRLNLHVRDGEFLVLVGPSGCGKTTTLRMLAGLENVDDGAIMIDDTEVSGLPPRNRDIAMVFQNYALYPHMTVAENMGFALKLTKIKRTEIDARVREAAELLDLSDYLARKPAELSGGQRQRVAMGRAIVRRPRVFLMDEPLSNLDAKLRVSTRTHIASLQRRLGVTTVYVTHDQVEAMTMGDRVAVMKDGVLQQVDTPRALYDTPANAFVAGFIGSPATNLIAGEVVPGAVKVGSGLIPLPADLAAAARPGMVTVGVRPEMFRLAAAADAGANATGGIRATVGIVEELGAESYAYVELVDTGRPGETNGAVATAAAEPAAVTHGHEQIIVRVEPKRSPRVGETVELQVIDDAVLLFDRGTGDRITAAVG